MPPLVQDRPDIQVFSEIGIIEHYMRTSVEKHLPPGMSYAHFEMLLHFVRNGDGDTPAELAQAMMLTKGAITNVLQKMEGLGLIVVLADVADRRKKRVKVTRAGIEAYNTILKDMKWKTDALRDGFTEGEFRAVLPFLKALRIFLEEIRMTDAPEAARR
jgi:DNA-binding MarR family transcriptional regulator